MQDYQAQAADFLHRHNIRFHARYVDFARFFEDDEQERSIYTLTLTRMTNLNGELVRDGRFSTRFGASIHMTHNDVKPTAYDLLSCLTKSDPGTFEDFCSEYGYETDSRRAERTYRKVKKEWLKVSQFFSAAELAELADIN